MGPPLRRLPILVIVFVLVLGGACSDGPAPTGPTPCGPGQTPPNPCPVGPAPAPTLASVAPATATAGSGGFTLTATGSGFTGGSVVTWNGSPRSTTFASATQLTAAIPASDVASAGTARVTVTTPPPGGGTTTAATFTITATPAPPGAIVAVVSANPSGAPGNGASFDPALSQDGRYVAFSSLASDLVAGDTNAAPDIFLRDTCRGASAPAGCVPSTIRVSLDDAGHQLAHGATVNNSIGSGSTVSGDGRYVVFLAQAGDILTSPNVPAYTVEGFERDTCLGAPAGCVPSTTLVTVGTGGAANANARSITVSRDGRVVVFICGGSNLAAGPVGVEQLWARDTCVGAPAGCTASNILLSATSANVPSNAGMRSATVSGNGRYAIFQTSASDLVAGDTNGRDDVFLRDSCIGAASGCVPSTVLVSASVTGGNSQSGAYAQYASVSADGRYVSFQSTASDLVAAPTGGTPQVFLRDTCAGAAGPCTPVTTLVSASASGAVANSNSSVNGLSELSGGGRYALFSSLADNLLPGVGAGAVYARDTCAGAPAGCTPSLTVVSVDAQGNVLLGASNALGSEGAPAISADGRFGVLERFDSASNATQAYLIQTGY